MLASWSPIPARALKLHGPLPPFHLGLVCVSHVGPILKCSTGDLASSVDRPAMVWDWIPNIDRIRNCGGHVAVFFRESCKSGQLFLILYKLGQLWLTKMLLETHLHNQGERRNWNELALKGHQQGIFGLGFLHGTTPSETLISKWRRCIFFRIFT